MRFFGQYLRGDRVIWAVVFILSLISILAVYSSTGTLAYKYQGGNTMYYFLKHLSIVIMGIGIMYLVHNIPYTYFSKISMGLIVLAVILLPLTLGMGTNRNDASRWLTVPIINMSFQTSDLAKLALITFLARQLAKSQDIMHDFKRGFLPLLLPILGICLLILPANFSTAAVLFASSLVLLFIGRARLLHIGALLGSAFIVVLITVLLALALPTETVSKVLPRFETWKARVETFAGNEDVAVSADKNYQADQAKIAVAKGGLFRIAPGKSDQRNFLPHPYSDFIYAIIIEEYGMVGGLFVLFLYLVLLLRVVKMVGKTEKPFASLLAMGCCFSLVFQGMVNMAVAVNLFPVTGQPLPLISMGGTSLWFTSIAIGMILSVSREHESAAEPKPQLETAHV